ncbi:MAG: glycosyl transferase, partial [Anaerolineae bacterium]|nr:glycosyl transferase [Anaerolineae bacterium]
RQYYLYARGDGKADLWRKRHLIRYLTYLVALPLLLALAVLHHPLWLVLLLAGALAYCWRPVTRLRSQWAGYSVLQRLWAILLIPVIRITGDLAKMIGYPAGLRWRRANRARPEIHWRSKLDSGQRYG